MRERQDEHRPGAYTLKVTPSMLPGRSRRAKNAVRYTWGHSPAVPGHFLQFDFRRSARADSTCLLFWSELDGKSVERGLPVMHRE